VGSTDSFGARGTIQAGGAEHEIFRLAAVEGAERLPFSLKVLLENLLRTTSARSPAGTPRPSRTRRSSSPRPG
jgi:aconitase A